MILESVAPDRKVLFTDLPGVRQHVYLFHLGYAQAVCLFYPEQSSKVAVVNKENEELPLPDNLIVYSCREGKFERVSQSEASE